MSAVPLCLNPKNPTRPFTPYEAQRRILTSRARIIVATGGVGFGKTATCAAWILGEAVKRSGTYLAAAPTYGQLEGALWQAIITMVHPALIVKQLGGGRPELQIYSRDGGISTIVGRTLSNPNRLLGLNLSGAALDEVGVLPDSTSLDVVLSRLREQGSGYDRLFLATNPHGHNWFWEIFVQPLEEIEDEALRNRAAALRSFVERFNVTTYQNPFLYDDWKNPLKGSETIRLMEAGYTPRARRRWLLGGFDDFQGEVYDAFNPDVHVVDMPAAWKGEWPAGWQLIQGVDFGFGDPFCALNVLVEPASKPRGRPTYWVVGEHYQTQRGLETHAAKMVGMENGRKLTQRYTDHEATVRHELQQRLKVAKSSNVACTPAVKGHIEVRIDFINRLLLGGRLKIVKGAAPNLVRELQTRDYDPKTKKPQDDHNHATDALEYAVYSYEETRGATGRIVSVHR